MLNYTWECSIFDIRQCFRQSLAVITILLRARTRIQHWARLPEGLISDLMQNVVERSGKASMMVSDFIVLIPSSQATISSALSKHSAKVLACGASCELQFYGESLL
ncbi:hypothetical protein D8674_022540 [Pyrus ussuriensis x Pyrus communis]|uniref:Uncharacterized protein n=1 Tax=Pyrus ussuriensis x Pyrus communis TaxID=2448454 RepID=A0A5N5GQL4_9ROSA|nr:hypothetical protein D8674_022540 [Pyrus ussuriensis x Pyrus communis]